MSIALGNNPIAPIPGNGFFQRSNCNLGFLDQGDRPMMSQNDLCTTSSSSSSIGENSDDDDEGEIQSDLKESDHFDSAIGALEQALPIRRGISKFYNGKSKSFASLGETTCSSIKEITKPENAYARKRKNLLAYSLLDNKGAGIVKRQIPSSRSTLGLAVTMGRVSNESDLSPVINQGPITGPVSPQGSPLQPSSWRSFSSVELQHCGVKSNLGCPLMMGKRSKAEEVRRMMTDTRQF